MRCHSCKAKNVCSAAVQPGSIICSLNLMRYGGTHADNCPPTQAPEYCQYCGHPLKVIGSERFCNNVRCNNRFMIV